jgi:C-terminal processing protease CtpA/Prc
VGKLERKLAKLESQQSERPESAEDTGESTQATATATAADRRVALVSAGVPEPTADDIVWRQSAWDLERLELQDQALREGWHRTERYYQELQELNDEAVNFRTEIGDQAYDRYLYQTGENNRVRVSSVIPGSEAELAGLEPGDVIESYGDGRIFDFTDLRNSTATGERGELVPVVIQRGDTFIEALVPRGPLGVRIEADRLPPDE